MAAQATRICCLRRQRFEADDLGDIPTAFYVSRSRAMTRLATVSVLERRLKVRSCFKLVLVEVFVTGLAYIGADVLGRPGLERGAGLLLRAGKGWPNEQRQSHYWHDGREDVLTHRCHLHHPLLLEIRTSPFTKRHRHLRRSR